jgi:hypothetical protein
MTTILGGFFLIFSNKNVSGFSLIAGSIATLVGLFIYGKKDEEQTHKTKKK